MSDSIKYRLDLEEDELQILRENLTIIKANIKFINSSLWKKITNPKIIKPSSKRVKNVEENRKKRSSKAQKKILKVIKSLKAEDKKLTAYAIAKGANVAYNTAKKYLKEYKETTNSSIQQAPYIRYKSRFSTE